MKDKRFFAHTDPNNPGKTPEQGAKTSIYLASSEEVKGITGLYFVKCKSQKSSDMSYDKMLARKLWDLSEKLTGFQFSENQ